MRTWHWLVGASAVAAGIIVACGGSTDSNPTASNDAGTSGDSSVTKDSSSTDTNPDASGAGDSDVIPEDDSSVACTTDADINTMNPPDAALGDAGSSTGTCLSCIKTTCPTEINDCSQDCECTNAVACLYGCLGTGGNLIACFQSCGGISSSSVPLQSLGSCAVPCAGSCGIAIPGGPSKDAGTD